MTSMDLAHLHNKSSKPASLFRHLPRFVSILAIATYAALIVHSFFLYVDYAPMITTDDALANVSYTLAHEGYYGFPASPLQAPSNTTRNRGFMNYGPIYFYVGAALAWLFGFSLTLMRAISLLLFIATIPLAFLFFRNGPGFVAAALFGLAILHCFDARHIIIARPDTMVAYLALLFVFSAGLAIAKPSSRAWFLAGLAASSAAFSHLFAWSLIPTSLLLPLVECFFPNTTPALKRPFAKLFAVGCGNFVGGLIFLASFHFRIGDFLEFLRAYRAYHLDTHLTYWQTLHEHLVAAFGYLLGGRLIYLPLFGAGVSVLILWGMRSQRSGRLLPYLLPSTLALSIFTASLGLNGWVSAYYSVTVQFLTYWQMAALLYASTELLRSKGWTVLSRVLVAGSLCVLVAASVFLIHRRWVVPHSRLQDAQRYVRISDYIEEVLKPIPRRARVWGTIMFGIKSPSRVELLQFGEGANLVSFLTPHERAAVAPDYIVWGLNEERDTQVGFFQQPNYLTSFNVLREMFPSYSYRLIRLVDTPPYRVTRIYQKCDKKEGPDRKIPEVSMYMPVSQNWACTTAPRLDSFFARSAPASITLGYGSPMRERAATETHAGALPKGQYLIRVGLEETTTPKEQSGAVCVTEHQVYTETLGYLPAGIDCGYFTQGETEVYLVSRHDGGNAFISLFEQYPAHKLSKIEVFPAVEAPDFGKTPIPIPPLASWHSNGRAKTTPLETGGIQIDIDPAEQRCTLSSPGIDLPAYSKARISFALGAPPGVVKVGLWDENSQAWLHPPARTSGILEFTNQRARRVRIVLSAESPGTGTAGVRLTVGEGQCLAMRDDRINYTDMLVNEVAQAKKEKAAK